MKKVCVIIVLAFSLALFAGSAQADRSMMCNGITIRVGDSKDTVLKVCGKPVTSFSGEKIMWQSQWKDLSSVKTPIEKWVYDMGPDKSSRVLTFRGNTLIRIEQSDEF